MEPLKVLLVDDHALFRRGIKSVLASWPEVEVVGEAGDGLTALKIAVDTMPDVILMDINMPNCNGLEATRRLKKEIPYVKIVILTVSDDDHDLFEAIKAGAQGYLLKNLEPEELKSFLAGIARSEAPISGVMAGKILAEFARYASQEHTSTVSGGYKSDLSAREKEVLKLISKGLSNKEISQVLSVTENTVKNHLRNILEKLHLENRVQAAVYAIREGLVDEV